MRVSATITVISTGLVAFATTGFVAALPVPWRFFAPMPIFVALIATRIGGLRLAALAMVAGMCLDAFSSLPVGSATLACLLVVAITRALFLRSVTNRSALALLALVGIGSLTFLITTVAARYVTLAITRNPLLELSTANAARAIGYGTIINLVVFLIVMIIGGWIGRLFTRSLFRPRHGAGYGRIIRG